MRAADLPERYKAQVATKLGSVKPVAKTGGKSDLEASLLAQLRIGSLPTPETQVLFAKSLGRRWRADFCWPGQMVIAEVDGSTWTQGRHTRGGGYHDGCVKQVDAVRLGYRYLRFDRQMVEDGTALAALTAVLRG